MRTERQTDITKLILAFAILRKRLYLRVLSTGRGALAMTLCTKRWSSTLLFQGNDVLQVSLKYTRHQNHQPPPPPLPRSLSVSITLRNALSFEVVST
jgi:hypothetical protein